MEDSKERASHSYASGMAQCSKRNQLFTKPKGPGAGELPAYHGVGTSWGNFTTVKGRKTPNTGDFKGKEKSIRSKKRANDYIQNQGTKVHWGGSVEKKMLGGENSWS